MSLASPPTAPIERVTIPLTPRTPAGCCDLAVMYYGRYIRESLRLFAAVVGPAAALVYGFGRFVGTDVSLAVVVGLIVSKPLGLLTIAGVARMTFGEPFEALQSRTHLRRTRVGRLRELTRNIVTAAAVIAAGSLIVAGFDDAYGTGRLTDLRPRPAAGMMILIVAVLVARSGLFMADYHRPGTAVRNGMLFGALVRTALALPLSLLFFDETRTAGVVVAVFWIPIAVAILLGLSFRGEQRVLAEIDPGLLQSAERSAALSFADRVGPAWTVLTASTGLSLMTLAAIEWCISVVGLSGPVSGPLADYFDPDSFDLGLALSAVVRSPLLAATALTAGLFAYQLGRIAWFFAYIDARVRSDCWDMELMLAREAKRLEGK